MSKTTKVIGGSLLLLGSFLVLIVLCVLAYQQGGTGRSPDEATSPASSSSVRVAWYCSPGSKWAAEELAIASAHDDMAAMAGHITRNGAFELARDTKVDVISGEAGGLSFVRVASGFHDGETCWFPSNLIK